MSDDNIDIAEEEIPLLLVMAAGCIAGAIEATATWPMEYIKTQLQLQQRPLPVMTQRLTSSWDNAPTMDGISMTLSAVMLEEELNAPPYTDMISGIVYTVRVHGFWALYQGLTPTLLGSIPKAGIRFGMFHFFSEMLRDDDGNISLGCYFLAGLAAGVLEALVIVAPVETIKTKCIELNMSFARGLREILVMEGIGGIYDGVFATVLKQGSVSFHVFSLAQLILQF
jgi:solute carrier family 25 citrate transporter 1